LDSLISTSTPTQDVLLDYSFENKIDINGFFNASVYKKTGINNIVDFPYNPGKSEYVLEQDGRGWNQYLIRFTDIKPNTNYLATCWVAKNESYNGELGMFYMVGSRKYGDPTTNLRWVSDDVPGSVVDFKTMPHPTTFLDVEWERRTHEIRTPNNVSHNLWWKLGYQNNNSNFERNTHPDGRRYITGIKLEVIERTSQETIPVFSKRADHRSLLDPPPKRKYRSPYVRRLRSRRRKSLEDMMVQLSGPAKKRRPRIVRRKKAVAPKRRYTPPYLRGRKRRRPSGAPASRYRYKPPAAKTTTVRKPVYPKTIKRRRVYSRGKRRYKRGRRR
jgi:hypothetical protein